MAHCYLAALSLTAILLALCTPITVLGLPVSNPVVPVHNASATGIALAQLTRSTNTNSVTICKHYATINTDLKYLQDNFNTVKDGVEDVCDAIDDAVDLCNTIVKIHSASDTCDTLTVSLQHVSYIGPIVKKFRKGCTTAKAATKKAKECKEWMRKAKSDKVQKQCKKVKSKFADMESKITKAVTSAEDAEEIMCSCSSQPKTSSGNYYCPICTNFKHLSFWGYTAHPLCPDGQQFYDNLWKAQLKSVPLAQQAISEVRKRVEAIKKWVSSFKPVLKITDFKTDINTFALAVNPLTTILDKVEDFISKKVRCDSCDLSCKVISSEEEEALEETLLLQTAARNDLAETQLLQDGFIGELGRITNTCQRPQWSVKGAIEAINKVISVLSAPLKKIIDAVTKPISDLVPDNLLPTLPNLPNIGAAPKLSDIWGDNDFLNMYEMDEFIKFIDTQMKLFKLFSLTQTALDNINFQNVFNKCMDLKGNKLYGKDLMQFCL